MSAVSNVVKSHCAGLSAGTIMLSTCATDYWKKFNKNDSCVILATSCIVQITTYGLFAKFVYGKSVKKMWKDFTGLALLNVPYFVLMYLTRL